MFGQLDVSSRPSGPLALTVHMRRLMWYLARPLSDCVSTYVRDALLVVRLPLKELCLRSIPSLLSGGSHPSADATLAKVFAFFETSAVMVVTPMPSRLRTASLILGKCEPGVAANVLHFAGSPKSLLPRLVSAGFAGQWIGCGRCAGGGMRALTLERASPTSATDVMPWLDLACVAIQSIYYLARVGLTVKDPVGGLSLWWLSIPLVLPEQLVSPQFADDELWSRTCPHHLAEAAQFNWLSQVGWMAGVQPEEGLSLARAKSGQWLNFLNDEVLSRLQALGWDKTELVVGSQEVPTDLHQGRLWNQLACLRYLQQILSSARELTDDDWVTKAVQETMMHWHSS
eukprot:6178081-Pleurochrysis_carterae.AAC.4